MPAKSSPTLTPVEMCIRDRRMLATDLAGMADAAEMLSGINAHWFVVVFALLISWATVRLPYHPVSYTHLDVYKRQVLWLRSLLKRLPSSNNLSSSNNGRS